MKPEEKVFLFVGRINALKNIFLIAEALKILKEKEAIPFKMLFVGSGQDEEELKAWITTNQMENEIILCGRITDRRELAAYYKRADLFLFPSLYDASSLVQIEASSQKTPTVFVKGAATASNIIDNKNGFIAENEKEKYAERIVEIIQNQEVYHKVKEQCYLNLYHHWDDLMKVIANEYRRMIEKKR